MVYLVRFCSVLFVFFQAEDGIRDLVRSRGLGDVYKRQRVSLRPTEYRLLYHLIQNAGWVVPHETLLTKVWAVSYTHLTLPTSDLV